MAQLLREATPWGEGPRFLIRDHDDKVGGCFGTVANGTGITILRTPVRAPNANAVCERFPRSVRAERLAQTIPNGPPEPPAVGATAEATPILAGLHHDYRRAA